MIAGGAGQIEHGLDEGFMGTSCSVFSLPDRLGLLDFLEQNPGHTPTLHPAAARPQVVPRVPDRLGLGRGPAAPRGRGAAPRRREEEEEEDRRRRMVGIARSR